MGFTDNVIEFLVTGLKSLPVTTLSLLQVASCFGTRFDIVSVADCASIPRAEVESQFWALIRDGKYILRIFTEISRIYCKNRRDRIFFCA
jgi:predicted ATPase